MNSNFFTKSFALITLAISLSLISFMAFGQAIEPLPEVNIFEQLGALVLSWASLSSLAKGSIAVLILTQVVKQVSDFEYKNVVVTLMSVIYAVIQMMIDGTTSTAAITMALFSMGGAVLIYNAIKPALLKIPFFSFLKLGSSQE